MVNGEEIVRKSDDKIESYADIGSNLPMKKCPASLLHNYPKCIMLYSTTLAAVQRLDMQHISNSCEVN